jgi:hypothetical protein
MSIYLGFPKIKKRLPIEGNRSARIFCGVPPAASEPVVGAIWSGHQVVYENGRAGQRWERAHVAQKIRFPAWRTAEVGEKFGINVSAFKAAFSARRNYSGRAAIQAMWDITAVFDPRTLANREVIELDAIRSFRGERLLPGR